MPLVDFMRGRRTVESAGRAYSVGPPTVGTVYRLIELFPAEIDATRRVFAEDGIRVAACLPVFMRRRDDFLHVLETVVETEHPRDVWPVDALASASIEMCDVKRIASAFSVENAENDYLFEPWHEDVAYCQVAKFFGVTPLDLMRWPFEAYLSAKEAASRILSGDTEPKRYMRMPADQRGIAVM